MKRFLTSLLVLCALVATAQYYKPDVLGNGFEQHTFVMPDDYHGPVVSTLVRKMSPVAGCNNAVLYVHGYNDYFFQEKMAEKFIAEGFNFYAVDLRKYGRSIRPGQYEYEARDISEYYADIDSAMVVIEREGNENIVLMGHSTGGLVTSMYCHSKGDSLRVDALILNSPFFEWNFNAFYRNILIPLVASIGKYHPDKSLPDAKSISAYAMSLLKEYEGEWDYNKEWKKLMSRGERFGWIRAIDEAHKVVHKEMHLTIPVLLLHSDKSVDDAEWTPAYRCGDAVLNVEHIAKYGSRIGCDVTAVTITDGLHDLVLSRYDVREEVYKTIFNWIESQHITHGEN